MAKRLDIFLKSGGIVSLDVTEAQIRRTKASNQLVSIDYTLESPEEGNCPLWVDLGEVAAVVVAR